MGVHGLVANDAAVGGTIGTFDAINTRNADLRLRDKTTAVVGLAVAVARTAQTTGDAQLYRLRMASDDLGVANQDFELGASSGGGTATNSGAPVFPVEWIPIDLEAKGGNVVNLFLSQMGIESADNVEIQVALAHVAGDDPPQEWYDKASVGATLPLQGNASSNGGSTAQARTSITAATIAARYRNLVSFRCLQAQDPVPVAGEAGLAFTDITSTIGNFGPQEWPVSPIGASLGTATGVGPYGWSPRLPFWFVKEGQTETIEPFVTILTAVGAANAFGYGMGLRRGD